MALDPKVEAEIARCIQAVPDKLKPYAALKVLLHYYPDDEQFAREFIKIKDKRGHLVPFQFNTIQRALENVVRGLRAAGKRVLLVILKPRQVGCSLWTQYHMLMNILRNDHHSAVVIADSKGNAKYLFGLSEGMFKTFPFNPARDKESTEEIAFLEPSGSDYHVDTANNPRAGRSRSIQHLHASEVAFWPNPEIVMDGLQNSIVEDLSSWIVLESTAFGMGNYYHSKWTEAVEGQSDYAACFFPWYLHDEYELAENAPEAVSIANDGMDEEESALAAKGVPIRKLAWRRWAIKNKCRKSIEIFHQEYPATAEEAFLVSGRPVFPIDAIRQMELNCVEEPIFEGDLEVLEETNEDVQHARSFYSIHPKGSPRARPQADAAGVVEPDAYHAADPSEE